MSSEDWLRSQLSLAYPISLRADFYIYSGDLCVDSRKVRRNYLTGWMFIDALGSLPVFLEVALLLFADGDDPVAAFRYIRMLRLARISKLVRFEKSHYTYLPGLRVGQLFCSFFGVVHIIACVMYLLFARRGGTGGPGMLPHGLDENATIPGSGGWLNDDEVAYSVSERYADAIYISLLIVVGEDSYPRTSAQRSFVVVAMILGACFYATVVGSVAMLVKNADVQTSIYHEHMDALNSKMELMGLSQDLRQRVVSYYSFVWKRLRTFSTERGEFQLNVENFLQELPLPLREEISLFLHKHMVERVPIFNGCAEAFICDIVVHLRPQVNMPNETLIEAGSDGDSMFFVSCGAIEIFTPGGDSIRTLKSGDYLGEFALLTAAPRSATAVARTFVLLHVLLKQDFDRIMAAWPEYEASMAAACEKRMVSAIQPAAEPSEMSSKAAEDAWQVEEELGSARGGGQEPRCYGNGNQQSMQDVAAIRTILASSSRKWKARAHNAEASAAPCTTAARRYEPSECSSFESSRTSRMRAPHTAGASTRAVSTQQIQSSSEQNMQKCRCTDNPLRAGHGMPRAAGAGGGPRGGRAAQQDGGRGGGAGAQPRTTLAR